MFFNKKKTAKFIKNIEGFTDAKLYKLSKPLDKHEYVIVSATTALYSGPETCIFPATKSGYVVSYGELTGSYRGGLDHEQALKDAGYKVR